MIIYVFILFVFLVKRFSENILLIFIVQGQSWLLSLTVRDIIRKKESDTIQKEPLFLKNMA